MRADTALWWRHHVADRLGITVATLEATMSAQEFRNWQAFILLERGHTITSGRPARPPGG